jgi:C1A family cysteine protease
MLCTKRKIFNACIIFVVMIFTVLVASEFVRADTEELNQIRHEIKAKGAKWHADETSVSVLSAKERKMRLGVKDDLDLAALVGDTSGLTPLATVTGVPTLDWRNVNGLSYVSTIKNQGSCGSCWAFAVTAALESQAMITTGGQQVDLSEQILVSCSGAGSCSGGYPSTASNYIRDVGLPLESCFVYTATNNLCSNACANWQTDTYTVKGWHTASTSGTPSIKVEDIKSALYTYGPVLATFYVYNDFFSYRSGVYTYTSGSYAGAHAVLIVGYDDTLQAFIVKNSWGSGWGEAGYFMVAYSEVGGTSKFAYSSLAYDGYGDNPTPPVPPTPCTYAISPTGKTFKAAGGTGSFTVSTQSGCPWSASEATDWVQITSGSSGTGSGTVYYSVSLNISSSRTATIGVEGQSYKITEQAAKVTRR